MRPDSRAQTERITAAIRAGADRQEACANEGITTGAYSQRLNALKNKKGGNATGNGKKWARKIERAPMVIPLVPPGRSDTKVSVIVCDVSALADVLAELKR